MNETAPLHPEVGTLVAFLEGRLEAAELADVAEHLRGCDECRTVVSETAGFEREEQRVEVKPRRTRAWWLAAAAAVSVLAVLISIGPRLRKSPIEQLIAAAPRQHRTVSARLADFPWRRYRAPTRGSAASPDPADMKLAGAAGEVLEDPKDTREWHHAAGVAYLLIGHHAEAITSLERAAEGSRDPRVWNDLAAALYAVGVDDERSSQLPRALAAADRALELDPRSAGALFNRALILEHLGVRDQARRAWEAYLAVDGGSEWASEARQHLRALSDRSDRFDPKLIESLPPLSLVQTYPMEARTYGEGPLLADWAKALLAKDEPAAGAKLTLCRAIGKALAEKRGEWMLADAVAAIDRADDSSRRDLADAHVRYAAARLAFSKRSVDTADFDRVAALFDVVGSPMGNVARYYAAMVAFARNGGQESFDALNALTAKVDVQRHRALAAQIEWSLAVAATSAGEWGNATRAADASVSRFRALGETRSAAVVDAIGAHALDQIGGEDAAWKRYLRAFAALDGTPERARFLRAAAATRDRFGDVQTAKAMIALAIEDLDHDPAQRAVAMNERARYLHRAGETAEARRTVVDARAAAAAIADSSMRSFVQASLDVTHGALRRETDARASIGELDRAAGYFRNGRLNRLLPEVYLERARSRRAAGDDQGARADYQLALVEIEMQRSTIADGELRLRFLDTAAEIIEDRIALELEHGAVAAAFAVADGARELPGADNEPAADAPPSTALIEYVVLPREVAIFCAQGGKLSVARVAIDRAALRAGVAALAESVRKREDVRANAERWYRLLIAPVEERIRTAGELVIVPDRHLAGVPFAMLFDPSRRAYLAERFLIRLAPSASAAGDGGALDLEPAVVIGAPAARDWPRLPASRTESERVAAMTRAAFLGGDTATRAAVEAAFPRGAMIHYAGHADADGSLVLAGDVLPATGIARMTLPRQPLVVLAACGTFRGTGGMSSLSRAFLLAGARAVVGTLSDVDDDVAAQFFLRFHELLQTGASPAHALRATQIEMIHASDARLRHPAAWAPVEITQRSARRMSWFR